jgi:hypothetical protein
VCGVCVVPPALEHSKVCTRCDFGHLQFLIDVCINEISFLKVFESKYVLPQNLYNEVKSRKQVFFKKQ